MDKRRLKMIRENGTLWEYGEALKEYYETEQQNHEQNICQCKECSIELIHKSDCAVHNEPATPNKECDCEPMQC